MAKKLSLFLSSTSEDLDPVRKEIQNYYRQRNIEVIASEDADFPVPPGRTSHEVCLENVRNAHVFVLLVAKRYGGRYRNQAKSITWREWDEAQSHGLVSISIIHRDAWDLSKEVQKKRLHLEKDYPHLEAIGLDKKLQEFYPDEKPSVSNFPGVQRLIEEIRKGHPDNWVHNRWNGEAGQAIQIIDRRLSNTLADYHDNVLQLRRQEVEPKRCLEATVSLCLAMTPSFLRHNHDLDGGITIRVDILKHCEQMRRELFGFSSDDLYNFCYYALESNMLVPGPRCTDPRIAVKNQRWPVDRGFVGSPLREERVIVCGDVQAGGLWIKSHGRIQADRERYKSAIGIPIYERDTKEHAGVFVVTSSRMDHFVDEEQPSVKAAEAVAKLLGLSKIS